MVGKSSRAWLSYLQFHALLLGDAEARERYQSAKRELARTFAHDRQGYTDGQGRRGARSCSRNAPPPHAG